MAFLAELRKHGTAIAEWYREEVKDLSWADIVADGTAPENIAIVFTDMINDFCRADPKGALYDKRIRAIIKPVVELLCDAYHIFGIRHIISIQEGHTPDAKEFGAMNLPPHGIFGTEGAELVHEIKTLLFAKSFIVFRKNSISPVFARRQIDLAGRIPTASGEGFLEYVRNLSEIRVIIAVGDCTNLCQWETAMFFKNWAHQSNRDLRIIVPENCVATFHLDHKFVKERGLKSHPAEVMHKFALHEMTRHGIDVVSKIV